MPDYEPGSADDIAQLLEDEATYARQTRAVAEESKTTPRPLYEIAAEILATWKNVYFGAVPYLEAMFSLDKITDNYFMDDGDDIVRYFLSNAASWRGTDARRIKAELKAMLVR